MIPPSPGPPPNRPPDELPSLPPPGVEHLLAAIGVILLAVLWALVRR